MLMFTGLDAPSNAPEWGDASDAGADAMAATIVFLLVGAVIVPLTWASIRDGLRGRRRRGRR